jgi:hypothetical protein
VRERHAFETREGRQLINRKNTAAITTVAATDPDVGQALSYSISGASDAGNFTIDASTGARTFATAPDFELPTDAGGNNVYNVNVGPVSSA